MEGGAAGALGGHEGVGQQVLDGLEGADRLAELAALGGVVAGEGHGAAHHPDQVGGRDGQAQGRPGHQVLVGEGPRPPDGPQQPPGGVARRARARQVEGGPERSEAHLGQQVAVGRRHQHQRRVGPGGVDRHHLGGQAVDHPGRGGQAGVEGHGLGSGGRRPAGQPPQLGGQGGSGEGDVGQAPGELLGDQGHLHPRGQGPAVVGRRPQLAPSRLGHGRLQASGALAVVELAHGVGAEAVGHRGRGVAQLALLGREPDVHQPGADPLKAGAHWSRSVRRSTLPDGSRGTASTTTTWRSCL